MNKKKLNIERKRIDSIDKKIFNLIKKRTIIVNHMIQLKTSRKQIVDHKRINEILKNIRKKSLLNKIDPKITNKIWKSIIWSYVEYQKRNFKKK
jgi:chorismate mutase